MEQKSKEIVAVEKSVNKAMVAVQSIVIKDDESLLSAGEFRKNIKDLGKKIKEEKEKATKPLNDVLKLVRGWFAPIEENYEKVESIVTTKMQDYQREVKAKRDKAEAEAQAKIDEAKRELEAGNISEKQAEKVIAKTETKLEKAPEVITKSSSFHTRKIPKCRIVNPSLIPQKYLVIDEVAVRKDVLKGIEVPGAEYYEEETMI